MKNFLIKLVGLQFVSILLSVCLICAIAIAENGEKLTEEAEVEAVAKPEKEPTAEPVAEHTPESVVKPTAKPGVETAAEPAEPEEEAGSTLKDRMQKRISIEFRNTPIEDALMLMADQADVDIVKSPSVTGSVTVKLTDVPLGEALDNILAAHGYGYAADKNMIRVAPASEISHVAERIISRIYRITYADVKEVESALKRFISKQGSLSSNPGTSNIIVTDTESQIKAIDEFIEEVDRITPQILVEARIYDISSTDRLDLGIEWQAGSFTNYGDDGLTTIGGAPGSTSTLTTDIIEYTKADGTTGYTRNLTDPHMTGGFSGDTKKVTGTEGLLRFGILTHNIDIDALVRAEQENVFAKLLANPRIMVLDNEEANIKIIEEVPYQQLTQTTGGGSIGTTQFKEVGVELTVTPHLTRDNMIRLHLAPKFSIRTGEILVAGVGYSSIPQPVIATREADTMTLIRSGETVVIGGLRKQDITQQKNKIPLLGDIPIVGYLFKFEGEQTINSELVVFITPYIIEQPTLSSTEAQHLKDTEIPTPKGPSTRLGKSKDE